MSSSPTDGATKNKNISLTSLLSSAQGDHAPKIEKQSKLITSSATSTNIHRAVSEVCSSIISRNLPTVANAELLYKSISSRADSLSQMPPLAPTQPKMLLTDAHVAVVQPFSSVSSVEEAYKHGYHSYTNVNNPVSQMKSQLNTSSVPATQFVQYQVINTISTTPVCSIALTQSHSLGLPISSTAYSTLPSTFSQSISSTPFVSNGEMSISNIDTGDTGSYKCEVVSEGDIGNANIEDCSSYNPDLVEQMSSFSRPVMEEKKYPSASEMYSSAKSEPCIMVPKGWNRIIEKGAIIYISPNKSRIRSYDDMIEYMESDNTCKCGLVCPVRPKELFNFDPKVSSKLSIADLESTTQTKRHCNACNEFDILLSTSLAEKRVGRRRRRGRIKNANEEEDKMPDRKKILLTGVSPLEMFQSGMQAINALSDSQFKNYTSGLEDSSSVVKEAAASIVNKCNSPISTSNVKIMNIVTIPPTTAATSPLAHMLPNTLPGGAHSLLDESSEQTSLSNNCSHGNTSNTSDSVNFDTDNDNDKDTEQNVNDNDNENDSFNDNNEDEEDDEDNDDDDEDDDDDDDDHDNDTNNGNDNSYDGNDDDNNDDSNTGTDSNSNYPGNNMTYHYNSNSNNSNSSNNNNDSNSNTSNNSSSKGNQMTGLLDNADTYEKNGSYQSNFTSFHHVTTCPRPLLTNTNSQTTHIQQITNINSAYSSDAELSTIAANIIRCESVVADQKRGCRSATRDRARTKTLDACGMEAKKTVKKVLPNVDVKKASDLQLSDYLKQPAYSGTKASMQSPSADVIPALKTINSDIACVSRAHVVSPSLQSSESTTSKINIYKSLRLSISDSQASDMSAGIDNMSEISPCSKSPPPNRTVSSANQLPEALVNQLGLKYSLAQSVYPEKAFITKVTSATNFKTHNASLLGRVTPQPTTAANMLTISADLPTIAGDNILNRPLRDMATSSQVLQSIHPSSVLHNISTPSNATPSQIDNGQQMLLLQFVSQNANQGNSTMSKVNAPIVCTYALPHAQGYIQQCPPKYVLMEKSSTSQTHANLVMINKSPVPTTPLTNTTKSSVHIQGLIPVLTDASQPSPRGSPIPHLVPNALPVQYVSPSLSASTQSSERTYPVMQYLQQSKQDGVSYLYQGHNCLPSKSTMPNITSNYVRIAPAVHSLQPATVSVYSIGNKSNGQEVNGGVQDLIKPLISSSSQETTAISSMSTGNVESSRSSLTHSDISSGNISLPPNTAEMQTKETISTHLTQVTSICNDIATVSSNDLNQLNISNMQSVYNTTRLVPISDSSTTSSNPSISLPSVLYAQNNISPHSPENVDLLSVGCASSQAMTTSSRSFITSSIDCGDQVTSEKLESQEETQSFNERSAESAIYSTPQLSTSLDVSSYKPPVESAFQPDQLVWVEIAGYPSWPGRILNCFEAKKPKLNDDKVYVSWFGSNQINAVDVNQLKSFDEGFKGIDGNLTKRGYRANKKQLNELEKAVAAALEYSERKGQHRVTLNTNFEQR